jgi:hypothetical protein
MMNANHFIARVPNAASDDISEGFIEHHLLMYDTTELLAGDISQNVRDLLGRYPFANEISICSPNIDDEKLFELVSTGTSLDRVTFQDAKFGGNLSTLVFLKNDPLVSLKRIPKSNCDNPLTVQLDNAVKEAWLFDLFHRHHCLVSAPDGIHFGKISGKHSTKFIRTANALVGSLECSLLAFFLLPIFSKNAVRKIYVDTGPLIGVAMSLRDQLVRRGIWLISPEIESFSSYDGIDKLSNAPDAHIVLISASTSGGLEADIVMRTRKLDRIATLFYIKATMQEESQGYRLCNLTETPDSFHGYPEIETYSGFHACTWCQSGVPLAEFEGDQFLLQRRKTQLINVSYHPEDETRRSLKPDAIKFFSQTKSRGITSVRITAGDSDGYRDVRFDADKCKNEFLIKDQALKNIVFCKENGTPYEILISTSSVINDFQSMPVEPNSTSVGFDRYVDVSKLQELVPITASDALVAWSLIASMLEPRKISELLRSRLIDSHVKYIAGVTIVETTEQLKQLGAALKTGARGPDTFGFNPGLVVVLRKRFERVTTWEKERTLLEKIVRKDQDQDVPTELEITTRLGILKASGEIAEDLFWPGQNRQDLKLQRDFVWMPIDKAESQADVYAVVSGLVSTAIQRNRDPKNPSDSGAMRIAIRDSLYSEALLDPNNFLKFNDAILRASFLRVSSSAELNYSANLELSSLVTQLVAHEIDEWMLSRGQILPEFLVALATGHMKLCHQHLDQLASQLNTSTYLPAYIKKLGQMLK